jgi:Fur family ferric uptake transcriptional regulator
MARRHDVSGPHLLSAGNFLLNAPGLGRCPHSFTVALAQSARLFYSDQAQYVGLSQVACGGDGRKIVPQEGKAGFMPGTIDIEALCQAKGLRITEQRRVIARVLSDSRDHPDVEELHRRAVAIDKGISIATVYRTVRLFEDAGILERHDFRDGRSRYEPTPDEHHDHLIDIETGDVIEFHDEAVEKLQAEIAARLGYRLVDHRMELYGVPLKRNN